MIKQANQQSYENLDQAESLQRNQSSSPRQRNSSPKVTSHSGPSKNMVKIVIALLLLLTFLVILDLMYLNINDQESKNKSTYLSEQLIRTRNQLYLAKQIYGIKQKVTSISDKQEKTQRMQQIDMIVQLHKFQAREQQLNRKTVQKLQQIQKLIQDYKKEQKKAEPVIVQKPKESQIPIDLGPFQIGQIILPQINPKYNLWTMPIQKKLSLLKKIKNKDRTSKPYEYPTSEKDEQPAQFLLQFEKTSEVINWNAFQLKAEQKKTIEQHLDDNKKQDKSAQQYVQKLDAKVRNDPGFYDKRKNITNRQYLLALQLNNNLLNFNKSPEDRLYKQETALFNQKYHFDKEKYAQIPFCVVVPSFNNEKDHRYLKGLEALMIQEYSNYRVIIVVDGSGDNTARLSANYLKYRNADPQKFILVHQKSRLRSLANVYYAAHKYCDYNQIFMVVDGDDYLVGRMVFKTFNQEYQKYKLYTLYSQYAPRGAPYTSDLFSVGISEQYPEKVRKENNYRNYKHNYSQLRSMMSDLMLHQRMSSLTEENGKTFFDVLADNAVMFPAFQMSCSRHFYLPQIFYIYRANTGINDYVYDPKKYAYAVHQTSIKKIYHCIDTIMQELQKESI